MKVQIVSDSEWSDGFLNRIQDDGPWANWDLYKLAIEVAQDLVIPDFEGLQAPKHLPFLTPLPHQLEAAKQVVEEMNGKAILADEVGLGKTIEAGLILKEYMIRGLVKKVLILVPASLVTQWAFELNTKFHIPAVTQRKSYVWDSCDVVVSSIDTAKRQPHSDIIFNQNYDFIIIDEAHKLKNNKTKNYEFVQKLKKKFCLLLTATPIQNKVDEIFHLVSLLKPGHLGNAKLFTEKYKGKGRTIHDNEHLKELVNTVMIRNRRADTKIEWTKRQVETMIIDFSKTERALYDAVSQFKVNPDQISSFSTLTLQREACSSRESVYYTLKNMKAKYENPSPTFTAKLNELFQKQIQVLIATEAGGEGINLQFCNHLINFDLPWNPMRLEQRIGRIHRLGQEKDVMIYNFATRDTVEEHILKLLYEKIHLFEKVVGELDDILTKLDITNIEEYLIDVVGESKTEGEMKIKMDNLSSLIQFAEQIKEGEMHAATGNS